MEHLITDRTSADVERWRQLHDKGFQKMSAAEKAEWLGFMKGRYTSEDMNRVESAVKAVSEALTELGYKHPTLSTKTNWTAQDCPTRDDMVRYFGNVAALREVIPVLRTTPAAPTVANRLNYARANDLEQILVDVDRVAKNIPQAWFAAGEIFSGEV